MSAKQKEQGTPKTPHERLAQIDERLEELHQELERRVNDGEAVGDVAAKITELREERPAVEKAARNWEAIQQARALRGQAEGYDRRANAIAAKTADWEERLRKVAGKAFPLVEELYELRDEMQHDTGCNPDAVGPVTLLPVGDTIRAVSGILRQLTDVYVHLRQTQGKKPKLDEIDKLETLVGGIRGIPAIFTSTARVFRKKADVRIRGGE